MSKKKETQIKKVWHEIKAYLSNNWKQFLKDLIWLTVPPLVFLTIALVFAILTVAAKSVIATSLIQAEATITGFLGVMVAYILTSLDSKENTYGKELLDLEIKLREDEEHLSPRIDLTKTNQTAFGKMETRTRGERLTQLMEEVGQQKRKIVSLASITVVCLLSSILLSILVLGITNYALIVILIFYAVYLLLLSFFGIIQMIRFIGSIRFRTFASSNKNKNASQTHLETT